MILLFVVLLVIVAILAGMVLIMYFDLKKVKIEKGRMREDFVEFEQALQQSRKYSDGQGWIAIKWVDRNDWLQGGSR